MEFGEKTQNKGYYGVQGHSRSWRSVTIKSPYTTSYKWLIVTVILSRTVSELSQIIVQISDTLRNWNNSACASVSYWQLQCIEVIELWVVDCAERATPLLPFADVNNQRATASTGSALVLLTYLHWFTLSWHKRILTSPLSQIPLTTKQHSN